MSITSGGSGRYFNVSGVDAPSIDWASDVTLTPSQLESGVALTGSGVPGAIVSVAFNSGRVSEKGATAVVGADGKWSLPLSPADLGVNGFGVGQKYVYARQTLPGSGYMSSQVVAVFDIPSQT